MCAKEVCAKMAHAYCVLPSELVARGATFDLCPIGILPQEKGMWEKLLLKSF